MDAAGFTTFIASSTAKFWEYASAANLLTILGFIIAVALVTAVFWLVGKKVRHIFG